MHRETLRSVRKQRGNCGKSLYCGFWGKKQVRQDKQVRIGQVENFPWALGHRDYP